MSKGHSLQDPYLNALRKGTDTGLDLPGQCIKLQGQIESFRSVRDSVAQSVSQMVYKHAISTVVPSRNVRLAAAAGAASGAGAVEESSDA